MKLQNVTLEMSLKPFTDTSEAKAYEVAREAFYQWRPLCLKADVVSVLLWAADGSEILDYKGNLDDTFEWGYWQGGANPRLGQTGAGLHSRPYKYMENPPEFTYAWLKRLLEILKEVGTEITGKPIRVGETFDPGPEFAKSPFKYERHNEVCASGTMGLASFMCCYATLNGDDEAYAAFPDGIPDGTSIGTFLGKQIEVLAKDVGFDYLWLSNGFGFGLETWGVTGAVFDGKAFSTNRCPEVRQKNLGFWTDFREACPNLPLETRGTNLSTGMDISSDAVPLADIYEGGFGMEPPPNSPWAAINGDFGLELVGWMSHIAEIPNSTYPFRFYTHDPWWNNSPWINRYGRYPHDIYIPLAMARLDETGTVTRPTSIEMLTIDDSYGQMPETVPLDVIPHIVHAWETGPDQAGPLLWAYPFHEYHQALNDSPEGFSLEEVFFGDWFIRGAVNYGLPLNSVISTTKLRTLLAEKPDALSASIVVSPVPQAGSSDSAALEAHVENGGKLMLYGPCAHNSEWLDTLGLTAVEPLEGSFELDTQMKDDNYCAEKLSSELRHSALLSAGGLAEVADDEDAALASASQGSARRTVVVSRAFPKWNGGKAVWVRGTIACDPEQLGGHLLMPYAPVDAYPAEQLMRLALAEFGIDMLIERNGCKPLPKPMEKPDSGTIHPLTCISRHRNGFFFSGFTPDTTVTQHLKMPMGAPLLVDAETTLVDGRATYHLPRGWRHECRVFVEQAGGNLACRTHSPCTEFGLYRRFNVAGLEDATVRFFPETGYDDVRLLVSPRFPFLEGDIREANRVESPFGPYLEITNITGDLLIAWK